MEHTPEPKAAEDHRPPHAGYSAARADAWQSLAWVLLGVATLIESLRMDRLEQQDINPYTIPGLLPACLGVVIIFLGVLMAIRSISRGALQKPQAALPTQDGHELRRIGVILVLCCGFALGMVGHGLSFWIAAALFITVTITLLQRSASGTAHGGLKGLLKAAAIGLVAGVVITLIFQEFFLVRLP